MATRTWMAGLVFLTVAAAAQARGSAHDDGCTTLGKLVEAGVHAAATQHELSPAALEAASRSARIDRSGRVASRGARRQVCDATVETVTRAFSRAMTGLGLPVTWNFPPHPGDYCWSGDLSQCYPSEDPTVPALPPGRLAFLYDAWNGVRRAVEFRMPRGTGGALSTFTEASLAKALSANLDRSVDGPLYEAYGEAAALRSRQRAGGQWW